MKSQQLRKLILTALLAALTCIATTLIQMPSPLGGYYNLGDCFVLTGAFLLGPVYGACAGGIGSMLADLLLGYSTYAPATLIIKGLMAAVAALLSRALSKRPYAGMLLGSLAGEITMAGGYFLFELALYGSAAVESLLMTNLPQGAVGLICAALLYTLLDKTHLLKKLRGEVQNV